jgi:hypothetical protein
MTSGVGVHLVQGTIHKRELVSEQSLEVGDCLWEYWSQKSFSISLGFLSMPPWASLMLY